MRILLFHPVHLPPKDYGGVERVVLWLARGLIARGHTVSIAASSGSQLPKGIQLIEVQNGETTWDVLNKPGVQAHDIIHFMAPPESGLWDELEKKKIPFLLTVHGNGKPMEKFPKNSVFLSRDHAARHGAEKYVYNGIDPEEYRFESVKENWFLFLSKTSWRVKNVLGAIDYCQKSKVSLKIAGGNRPILARAKVALNSHMRWIGPVNGHPKVELLAKARALIFPVLWDEPFGLVVVEALVSGTPVLASRRGSLPELLPPEVGQLLETTDQWIEALSQPVSKWHAADCRDWAVKKFHFSKMAESYESLYFGIVNGESLHQTGPITLSEKT